MKREVLLMFVVLMCCQMRAQQSFTVMSYNIENAFDTIHDKGKNDYEYCDGGERKWNQNKLFQKLKGISKVIAAADEKRPVDLIGLCEVENDTVMQYLTRRTSLKNLGYRYIMTNSLDERGDTVDVYVIHLPSKRGGAEGQKLSMNICQQLQAHSDSVRTKRQHPNLLIMGDFNAETNSPQLKLLTRSHHLIDRTAKLLPGTYKYQGEWSTIDHLLTHTTTLSHQQTRILTLPFLTEPDPTHGNVKPYRTYLGTFYQGGISDHLPIVGTFQLKKFATK